MRFLLLALAVSVGLPAVAEEKKDVPAVEKKEAPAAEQDAMPAAETEEVPGVEKVISERLKNLPEPAAVPIPKGIMMAVTTTEPAAQKHVLEGLANLHGGWDFEAYRHFCAALKLDPECLMAHWGVVVSLINPEPELLDERTAALQRMIALVDAEAGTELERSYAYAIAVFFNKGALAASDAFRKVSEKFPNDPQLKLLMAAFGRSGYDESGKPNPDQEKAESLIDEMLTRDPDHPLYLYAYLTIRAEAPDLRGDLARAHRLCELAPGYAPFLHLLGHYELRNGNATKAADAFARAAELYRTWMQATKVNHADCPGWVKAECYRTAALASKGDYANALAAAKAVAAIEVVPERANSEGGQMLMWEGRTLAARLLMRRGLPGDAALALDTLPDPEKQKAYGKSSHAVWFYQGLACALEARKALETGKPDEARKVTDALTLHGERMGQTRAAASAAGERSSWSRGYTALEILASETRGALAMASGKEGMVSAFNWYRAALDRQTPPTMLMPPIILLPMETRLAEYHLARGETQDAIDILVEAQGKHTHDIEILARLQKAMEKAGEKEQAKLVKEQIEKVKSE
jgi:tetratricopeptide (TPR) repeat protein